VTRRRVKAAPPAPKHLSAEARRWWDSLQEENDIADQAGLLLLQSALEAFDRMKAAQAAIKNDGLTFKDRFGQLRVNPATVVERDSRAAMLSALKSLNLDIEPPASGRQ
jgi:P27 family predicted phage terminase small subunit